MTPLEIRDAWVTVLQNNWTTTPIAWPNKKFEPAVDAPDGYWIRPNTVMGDTFYAEQGETGVGLRSGVLYIDIFGPKDAWDRILKGYAGTFETLFRRTEQDGLIFHEPTTLDIGETLHSTTVPDELDVYQVQVRIPFHCWIGE